jgi:hypothetical protein
VQITLDDSHNDKEDEDNDEDEDDDDEPGEFLAIKAFTSAVNMGAAPPKLLRPSITCDEASPVMNHSKTCNGNCTKMKIAKL